jgi:SAM-dependent methyltransferase
MSYAYRKSEINRRRKYIEFLEYLNPQPETTILDVGFSDEEYNHTDNYLEKNYPFQEKITALGVEEPIQFSKRYPLIKVLTYDGKKFPFRDKQFDIVWSNAVIEHIGTFEAQIIFLKEIKRVAKQAFITTPNKYFPIEVHTRTPLLHHLPKKAFDFYLKVIGKNWASGNYMNLLGERKLRELLKASGINDYHLIKNRMGGFVLDLVIISKNN